MTMTTARARRDRGPGGRAPRGGGTARTALAPLLAAGLTVVALLGAGLAEAPTARAAPSPGDTWIAELAVDGGDDTNVVATDGAVRLAGATVRAQSARSPLAEGELLLAPRRMPTPVDRVSRRRHRRPAARRAGPRRRPRPARRRHLERMGDREPRWPGRAPRGEHRVQVRATLVAGDHGAGPALQRIWLSADRTRATGPVGTATSRSSRPRPVPRPPHRPARHPRGEPKVFATREGLVGGTTANGHVIAPRDHFVALPSRRGLSPRNTGDYTVKVCAPNGRCAWSPVWDVGPWNTTDDYWNPAATRQSWKDLPQGTPEAQAAFQQRYNGGKDGFGRTVANPAGIDLADGTFYDDLALRDNSWVTVTYLWTGHRSLRAREADRDAHHGRPLRPDRRLLGRRSRRRRRAGGCPVQRRRAAALRRPGHEQQLAAHRPEPVRPRRRCGGPACLVLLTSSTTCSPRPRPSR